jgi:hypothetical protein
MRGQHFGDAPDARDLLQVLDDAPYSFEQVFLHALPSRWGYNTIEEWQQVVTRDAFLQRLQAARSVVDAKAASVERPEPNFAHNQQPSIEARPLVPPPPVGSVQKPQPVTAVGGNTAVASTGGKPAPAPQQTGVVRTPTRETEPEPATSSAVRQALADIVRIIERLSQQDQYELWACLVEKYDPR